MNWKNIHNVYFIGIGGIGMSALARLFLNEGRVVAGYDRVSTELTKKLEAEGAVIHYDDDVSNIPSIIIRDPNHTLIVYTPAIPKEHHEWNYFKNNNYIIKKRSEVIGLVSENKKTIAIAGTHGKTTVTTFTAHLLHEIAQDCLALLGGISKNYGSNVIINKNASTFVVEADEYDRSFLRLRPDIAVITSMDADHLDIYGGSGEIEKAFQQFVSQIRPGGVLIIKRQVGKRITVPHGIKKYTYTLDEPADFYASNISHEGGKYVVDLVTPIGKIEYVKLGVPGRINIENAVAATAAAVCAGLQPKNIPKAIGTFQGIVRRLDLRYSNGSRFYIDDYAHHPEEIRALVNSVKEMFPGKKITGVFQPHLYSRTRDFADGFATSLSLMDEVWLLDIYPAREEPIPGITSDIIFEKLISEKKQKVTKTSVLEEIDEKKPELLLTIGAGDIDTLVKPIIRKLEGFKT